MDNINDKGEIAMELTLHHTSLNCYHLIQHRVHHQEETQEAIVPDAYPDIMRIIQCCGKVYLRGKQSRDGSATVTGVVVTTVLYQPEGESGLRKLEVTLPFDSQIPAPALTTQGELVVTTRLSGVDARILNPRKLLLRGDIAISLQAYMPQQYDFCHSVTPEEGIQQSQNKRDAYLVFAVQGKPFTFTDQVRLPGQGEPGEVMVARGVPQASECKRIGNKLILKGELALQLLVRESAGGLSVSEHQIPFSQILESGDSGEAGDCQVNLELVQLDIRPGEEGGKQLEVQVEVIAQVVVRGQSTVALLEDVYSTGWEMETEQTVHTLTTLQDSSSSTQNLRELLELDGTVRKVVDCWCVLDEVTQQREGNRLQLSTDVHVMLLYLDESGSLQSSRHTVRGTMWVDCPQGICHCHCTCPQEIFATPAAGGVEVRIAVQFSYLLMGESDFSAVSAARLTQQRSREGCPSVVLRRGEPGERLWDLAKRYGTTCQEIISANGLEEDALPTGMMLIPSVRGGQ